MARRSLICAMRAELPKASKLPTNNDVCIIAFTNGCAELLSCQMSQETTQFTESERTEFEAVVGALAKWPRLSHLLRYMGNKLFADEVDQLNEYNIATEVLGRSRTAFNASEDAIARVETHRLRKRLTEFYEKEGKNHAIQVTLPAGSYVPVFIHKPEGAT